MIMPVFRKKRPNAGFFSRFVTLYAVADVSVVERSEVGITPEYADAIQRDIDSKLEDGLTFKPASPAGW